MERDEVERLLQQLIDNEIIAVITPTRPPTRPLFYLYLNSPPIYFNLWLPNIQYTALDLNDAYPFFIAPEEPSFFQHEAVAVNNSLSTILIHSQPTRSHGAGVPPILPDHNQLHPPAFLDHPNADMPTLVCTICLSSHACGCSDCLCIHNEIVQH